MRYSGVLFRSVWDLDTAVHQARAYRLSETASISPSIEVLHGLWYETFPKRIRGRVRIDQRSSAIVELLGQRDG